jgi:transposase
MIPLPTGWIAAGHIEMCRGMQSLALQVQEALKRDPHAGDLYVFCGRSGLASTACSALARSPATGATMSHGRFPCGCATRRYVRRCLKAHRSSRLTP